MSPQEAADFIGKMLPNFAPEGWDHWALCVAIAALEREAKAEPVVWLIKDGPYSVVQLTAPHPSYACMSTPLYASPPAPETK